jgi:hypothetical protein
MADRWKRMAPLAGIVFVGLVVASIMVSSDQPEVGDSAASVAAYYDSHDGVTIAQVVMLSYAAIFAVVYFVSVAQFLRARGAQTMATIALVGGSLAAAGCGLAAGASAMLAEANSHFDAAQMQVLNVVGLDLFWPTMVGGMVLSTLAIGVSILRTKALPKWFGILTVVVGVVGISGIGSWFGFMGSGVTTIATALWVYARLGRPESISLPEMPEQRADADVAAPDKAATT